MALFKDRHDAGRHLAERLLQRHGGDEGLVVLALPRGGVPVAYEVATALMALLDIFVVRKLGVLWRQELELGVVVSGGAAIIDGNIIRELELSGEDVDSMRRTAVARLRRREQALRRGRPPVTVDGKSVIIVDDGLATGASLLAGVAALRSLSPRRVTIAVPVASKATTSRLCAEVDEAVCLQTPEPCYGIAQWYEDFSRTTDGEVTELLDRANVRPAAERGLTAKNGPDHTDGASRPSSA